MSKSCSMAAFRIIDRDMDGKITTADLQKLFPEIPETEATGIIAASDLQGDGGIDISQFRNMLKQYFEQSESDVEWSKPRALKNENTRIAKLQALEEHYFRTVDDEDDDSHSSCAGSSVISGRSQTISHASRLDGDSDSDSDEVKQTQGPQGPQAQCGSGISNRRLPGAPQVRLAKSSTKAMEPIVLVKEVGHVELWRPCYTQAVQSRVVSL